MRRSIALLTALVALTVPVGCGEDEPDAAEDLNSPATTAAADPPEVVRIVSQSAAGRAEVSATATVLDDPQALEEYLGQFESAGLAEQVRQAVEAHDPGPGRVVAAAVISVGCDVPPGATITEDDTGWRVTPTKVATPQKECYVPVTSVAVLDLPAA